MNRHHSYWNRGGPQSSQISTTRSAETARYSYWTEEINAGKIDTGIGASRCCRFRPRDIGALVRKMAGLHVYDSIFRMSYFSFFRTSYGDNEAYEKSSQRAN